MSSDSPAAEALPVKDEPSFAPNHPVMSMHFSRASFRGNLAFSALLTRTATLSTIPLCPLILLSGADFCLASRAL